MKKLLSIIFRKKRGHYDPYELIKRFGYTPKAAR